MAVKSDIIDKEALKKSLEEVTSSIEKAFSSSLANVTKGITTALFLIARPSVVKVNTERAEKDIKNLDREIENLNSTIEKKKSLSLDVKNEEKALAILKEKKTVINMTSKEIEKEINLLEKKYSILNSFDTINIKNAGIEAATNKLKELSQRLQDIENEELEVSFNMFFETDENEINELNTIFTKLKEEKTNIEVNITAETDKIDTATQEIDQLKTYLKALGVDDTTIDVRIKDAKVKDELAVIDKQLEDAEEEKKIKLKLEGFEKVVSKLEQVDKAVRAFGGMASAAFALADQEMQMQIDGLDEKYETEQETLDKNYEQDVDKLSENLETKQGMLDELDERDLERQAIMDEIETAKTEEERARLEAKLKDYEGDAEKRILLNGEIAAAEDQLLLDKDAAETQYNIDKENKEKTYLKKKADMERKQAITAKAMKLTEAIIGTASAILAATISGLSAPWPISMFMIPILVGMAAVTGAIQIAAIARTPIPEIPSFSFGGIVSGSNDHLFPNIPKSKNSDDRTLAWLSEGEMVLTRNQTEMYDNIIARDTFNSVNNSNINHITNDIKIYTDNKTNTKLLAKQIVLEISRGYS